MKIGDYEIQVPFVTTSSETVKHIVQFAGLKPGQRIADLGSGDGRVILELGKAGLIVHGFEHNEELVERSKERVKQAGLEYVVTVSNQDYWTIDLTTFDAIYVYGMTTVMGRLEKSIQTRIKPGTKVITNVFPFPSWREKKSKDYLHLYIKK